MTNPVPTLKQPAQQPLPLQAASMDIWQSKYQLKDREGTAIDATLDDSLQRVARALADVEATPELRAFWFDKFLQVLKQGAVPAGRIIANAGAGAYKPATSTINCTVSGTINDSMDDILNRLHQAGMTLKSGCGIGYEFSTLRPRGAHVTGAGANTSGPLSFMDIYDRMCFTISSAGGRRGAQMATFDIGHPDVTEFIHAKREHGRLRQFNLSLLISDEFMKCVEHDKQWPLCFPLTEREIRDEGIDLYDQEKVIWRNWPVTGDYPVNSRGEVACRVYQRLPARQLWDSIMISTYEFAEPGCLFIDNINELNNNWFCEEIRASNPCGEQPLPPYGACLLGSINLTSFVQDPFTKHADFDWEKFRDAVKVFTRMLDNSVEIHGLPLPQQAEEIRRKRRHGMGFFGLGSALTMLRMNYGGQPSLEFTERVSYELALAGWETALELAREKGSAPIMEEEFEITDRMLIRRPELMRDGYRKGDRIKGRLLHAGYSRYMQRLAKQAPQLVEALAQTGARFTHHSSIAPTGTIALSFGNNASNGIEPSFAHHYSRNVIVRGRKSKQRMDVYSYELLAYRAMINPQAIPESTAEVERLPDYFVSSADITPEQHISIQAAAQRWVDSSISKTINVPSDIPYRDFQDIYVHAWQQGLKGCTTFRYNPDIFQGVLVRDQDLADTTYRFVLEDGEVLEVKGNQEIEYDGEVHTAANLFEALKEGYYNRY